jgi:hypothetical protein
VTTLFIYQICLRLPQSDTGSLILLNKKIENKSMMTTSVAENAPCCCQEGVEDSTNIITTEGESSC